MKISLNEGETCTICMNHNKHTKYYTFVRNGDTLSFREFEELKVKKE